ncbi:R3H and coiled-coil domain-containing protein 1 [Nematolebias whitei]|uniref:R3H and coiled-coil domain-containing protein 1 n=1 Tax=Nematolebias whitei TaxID=451745 RepID=UPI00189A8296|nr:R3H and coiled-coil domain-containing protein 1 [Nematolebias whitei]
MDDLETYQQENNPKSVLLFPPLPSRLRYLVHRTVEDMAELSTFSVGESWCRQVVVCHSEFRRVSDEDGGFQGNGSYSEEPLGRKEEVDGSIQSKAPVPAQSRAPKRPDQALFVPRAVRVRRSLQNSQSSTANEDSQSSAHCSSNSLSSALDSSSSALDSSSSALDSSSCPETTELKTQQSCAKVVENKTNSCANSSGSCFQDETQELALSLHESEAVVWNETRSLFSEMSLAGDESEDQTCPSDKVQMEDTSTDDVSELIKAHLQETDCVSIKQVHSDYSLYENVALNSDDLGHVIEIYNFPALFKTNDLLDAFTDYSDGGMKIKWVDDTHALGVFSTEAAALHALSICHPLLKTRALSKGSKKAKSKAIRCAEFIQPVKERPRTDCAVAKRMVTRALGIQGRGRLQRY